MAKETVLIFGSGATTGSGYGYSEREGWKVNEKNTIPMDSNFWQRVKISPEKYPALYLLNKTLGCERTMSMEKTWSLSNLAHQYLLRTISKREVNEHLEEYKEYWRLGYSEFIKLFAWLEWFYIHKYVNKNRRSEISRCRDEGWPSFFCGDYDVEFRHLVRHVFSRDRFTKGEANNFEKLFKNEKNGFDIITFNYDLLAEANLQQPWTYISENNAALEDDRVIKVVKLHGSLNWLQQGRMPIQLLRDEISPEYNGVWFKQPAMIPPTANKVEVTRPENDPNREDAMRRIIFAQWQCAREVLKKAKKWIFIGYGFPDTDKHAKELFSECCAEKTIEYCSKEGKQKKETIINELLNKSIKPIYFCWNGFENYNKCVDDKC